jgi:hypothetical protein
VLAEALRQHDGVAPAAVVLTHPVSWKLSRRRVLADAYQQAAASVGIAGLEPVFVPEPVAAANWYARQQRPAEGSCLAVLRPGWGHMFMPLIRSSSVSATRKSAPYFLRLMVARVTQ